ncbi:unnamed protein product [Cylindrotheca closterium]|uniref:Dickkopf N-terminal cysteine-rich domain-containing protein n=1 Tax=Cylindrotheca closterium TaxID=2856 RepID=A0AAD2G262_9STRA|nr:unnamed protein product [Cylindrotheca closterium]
MKLFLVAPFLAALIGIANAESVGTIRGSARNGGDNRARSHDHRARSRTEEPRSHDHGRNSGEPRGQQDEMIRTSPHAKERNDDMPRSYDHGQEERGGDGSLCFSDSACDPGTWCVRGFCQECRKIDSTEDCPSGEFCSGPFYNCKPLLNEGQLCLSDNACESGDCDRGMCASGDITSPTPVESVSGDGEDGSLCLSDNACGPGTWCVRGFCQECRKIDSTEDCPSGEFCSGPFYNCKTKLDKGGLCLSDNACKSGDCDSGMCAAGDIQPVASPTPVKPVSGDGDDGSTCLSDSECENYCVAGFCQECEAHSHCGSGDEFCTGWPTYNCKDKKNNGSWCGTDMECLSGDCGITWAGVKCK